MWECACEHLGRVAASERSRTPSVPERTSAVLGACIAFLVGRRIPESWRSRFFPKKLLQLQDAVAQGGFTTLLLLRLTPLPFAFSNLLLGSSAGVSFWSHAAATAIGFLRLALNSFLGTTLNSVLIGDGASGTEAKIQSIVTLVGTAGAIAATSKVAHQMIASSSSSSSSTVGKKVD